MSNLSNLSNLGKFVPGFDFLQNMAKQAASGASQNIPQIPNLGNWIAPTLNVEELDKRIEELKAVQFWLDQNAMALKATIQALEVQKMTLATLKGMNFNMGDVANAFKLKAADSVISGVQKVTERATDAAKTIGTAAGTVTPKGSAQKGKSAAKSVAGVVDPLQWWGALTQQFGQIAATAMKDAAKQTALDTTKGMASGLAKGAFKTASNMANAVVGKSVVGTSQPATKVARKVAKKAPAKKRSR